jgi:pimeloyl-ACP methyl ester carboxylesterase
MQTLILLPGLACDKELWQAQRAALLASHPVQVSDVHTRAASLPEMATLLLAEHPGPLVLVGSSMGGMLALHAWRQAPQRIRGLALLGSTARPDTPELIALRSQAIELFAAGRTDEVLRANVPLALHAGHAHHAALVDSYLAMIRRAGNAQLIAQNRAVMAREDARPWLPHIACPTLVVCGEGDLLTPPEHSREIAAAVPGARLELLADCGHLLTLEQPARVNGLLLDWLAQIDPAQCAQPSRVKARSGQHPPHNAFRRRARGLSP